MEAIFGMLMCFIEPFNFKKTVSALIMVRYWNQNQNKKKMMQSHLSKFVFLPNYSEKKITSCLMI